MRSTCARKRSGIPVSWRSGWTQAPTTVGAIRCLRPLLGHVMSLHEAPPMARLQRIEANLRACVRQPLRVPVETATQALA
jgi:hypothetical protein